MAASKDACRGAGPVAACGTPEVEPGVVGRAEDVVSMRNEEETSHGCKQVHCQLETCPEGIRSVIIARRTIEEPTSILARELSPIRVHSLEAFKGY